MIWNSTIMIRLIGKNITIGSNPGTDLWSVKLDPSQVDQILADLAVNQRDAVSGAGTLSLKPKTSCLTKPIAPCILLLSPDLLWCSPSLIAVAAWIRRVAKHIFEPFFTAKAPEGTGLELAAVYGRVQQNHGLINVYAEPGVGTTFKTYLPRYAGSIEIEMVAKTETLPKDRAEMDGRELSAWCAVPRCDACLCPATPPK